MKKWPRSLLVERLIEDTNEKPVANLIYISFNRWFWRLDQHWLLSGLTPAFAMLYHSVLTFRWSSQTGVNNGVTIVELVAR